MKRVSGHKPRKRITCHENNGSLFINQPVTHCALPSSLCAVCMLCVVGIHSLARCLSRGPVNGVVERALLGPLACGVRGCCHHGAPSLLPSVHHLARPMSCACAQCLGIAARWRVVKGGGIGSPGLRWQLRAVVGVGGCGAHGWALGDQHRALVCNAWAFGPGGRWSWGVLVSSNCCRGRAPSRSLVGGRWWVVVGGWSLVGGRV